ncbi:hypothetical protein NL676_034907 [Syzygium grande]|nr:hypothetical protein NL676_034907 [Syzygium grande]
MQSGGRLTRSRPPQRRENAEESCRCSGSPEEVADQPVQPLEPADHITGSSAGDVAERKKLPEEGAPATSETS